MSELEFDPQPTGERELEFDPVSGGAFAAKELAPGQAEQGERRRKLMQLVETKGEPGYGARLVDNFTFGLNRPLGGVASVLGGGSWKAGVGAEEDYIRRAEANTNPYLGTAVDVLGGMAAGGPAASLGRGAATVAQQAPGKLDKVARWLMGSTGSSAIEGAARGSESAQNAAIGAGVGAATGKIASSAVGALTDRLALKAARDAVSESSRMGGSKILKEEGGAIFDELDAAGIKFGKKATPQLVDDTKKMLKAEGYNPEIHKELTPIIDQINALKGKKATWNDLKNIGTLISDGKASNDPRVQRMAGHLSDVMDNFVDTAKAKNPTGIDIGGKVEEAKSLWRRGSQASNVEYLAKQDMLTTTDPTRTLRTNFGEEANKIIDPTRFSTHQGNPAQTGGINAIAQGDPRLSQAAAETNRWSNNLLGYGSIGTAGGLGLLSTLNDPYGISAGGSALGATAMGLGLLGKKGAGSMRRMAEERGAERVNALIRNIVTGSSDTPAVQNVPREALAELLAAEQVKRGVGRYSSNWYDKE